MGWHLPGFLPTTPVWVWLFVVRTTQGCGWLVSALIASMVIHKTIRNQLDTYHDHRRALYQTRVIDFLSLEDASLAPLRPLRPNDALVVEELLLRHAENLRGDLGNRLREAFEQLGYVDREIRRLGSRQDWIRVEAAHRLGLMRSPLALKPLRSCLRKAPRDLWLAASHAMATIDPAQALQPILELFKDTSRWAWIEVARTLQGAGSTAVPVLLNTLDHPRKPVRLLVLEALGNLRDARAVEALSLRTTDPDPEVRIRSVRALGVIGDPRSLDILAGATKDPNGIVRLVACDALQHLGHAKALDVVAERLQDKEEPVRLRAGEILSRAGTEGYRLLVKAHLSSHPIAMETARRFLPLTPMETPALAGSNALA